MQRSAELALHRFGYGARPGEVKGIGDPQAWLLQQVQEQPEPAYFGEFMRASDIWRTLPNYAVLRTDPAMQAKYKKDMAQTLPRQIQALLQSAVTTATPYFERLVWFWANHLSITMGGKEYLTPFAFDYLRSAIRPHVTGKFSDLLLASARHPAMLLYLDNASSTGPHSRAGIANKQGINENYAREVMELHTMGVSGGYAQTDVQALASILTGWTLQRQQTFQGGDPYGFQPALHEPGPKTFLGKTYDEGEAAGVAALNELAHHPVTAKRLAHKFAAHFVADEPPPALTDRLQKVFLDTGGDLGEMARELVRSDDSWQLPLAKARDAMQFVVAGIRLTGAPYPLPVGLLSALVNGLNSFGQGPFQAPTPQGWPDTVASQFGPDQVVDRAEWAQAVAGRAKVKTNPADLAREILGPLLSNVTASAISAAPSPTDGFAMLIASPEVMRR